MPTKERKDIDQTVLSLKQASVARTLQAARQALASGQLRTLGICPKGSYDTALRVKSV
jgi:hypothetical protein